MYSKIVFRARALDSKQLLAGKHSVFNVLKNASALAFHSSWESRSYSGWLSNIVYKPRHTKIHHSGRAPRRKKRRLREIARRYAEGKFLKNYHNQVMGTRKRLFKHPL